MAIKRNKMNRPDAYMITVNGNASMVLTLSRARDTHLHPRAPFKLWKPYVQLLGFASHITLDDSMEMLSFCSGLSGTPIDGRTLLDDDVLLVCRQIG